MAASAPGYTMTESPRAPNNILPRLFPAADTTRMETFRPSETKSSTTGRVSEQVSTQSSSGRPWLARSAPFDRRAFCHAIATGSPAIFRRPCPSRTGQLLKQKLSPDGLSSIQGAKHTKCRICLYRRPRCRYGIECLPSEFRYGTTQFIHTDLDGLTRKSVFEQTTPSRILELIFSVEIRHTSGACTSDKLLTRFNQLCHQPK